MKIKVWIVLVCLISVSFICNCALFELKDEIEEFKTVYRLTGKLKGDWDQQTPMIAVLYRQAPAGVQIEKYAIVDPEGHYTFLAPEGDYYLVVFEDTNQNFNYDDGEHFGFANQSDPIHLNTARTEAGGAIVITELDIEPTRISGFPSEMPVFMPNDCRNGSNST